MKRFISLLLIFTIFILQAPYSYSENDFSIKHSIINSNEEFCNINIVTPYFEGFHNADEINRQIMNHVTDLIGEARATSKALENLKKEMIGNGEESFNATVSLFTTYDYVKNGDILSIQLNTSYYAGGAHGNSMVESITANIETSEIYTFRNLFKEDSDYNKIITNMITDSIDKNPEWYFEDYAQTIRDKNGNFKFYIDGDKLIVYFDLYDIVPFAAGMPRFVIDSEDIKDLLKDEIYNSITNGQKRGLISYNGSDIHSKNKILNQDTMMIPLRDIAESLGYKVDWNRNDGAIVAEGFIKNEVNSYWTTGKEPISIITPVIIDGVTFVPIQYFTEVLEENVSFGNMNYTYIPNSNINNEGNIIVRVFSKKNSNLNSFNNLITQFENPISELDAINMYAEAIRTRNGAIQYGLLTDELRGKRYKEFSDQSFVTGTSSPWVDSYEIINIVDNNYQISFNLITSVPTDSLTTTINLKVIEDGLSWRIEPIE